MIGRERAGQGLRGPLSPTPDIDPFDPIVLPVVLDTLRRARSGPHPLHARADGISGEEGGLAEEDEQRLREVERGRREQEPAREALRR